jgi:hypothetical protein
VLLASLALLGCGDDPASPVDEALLPPPGLISASDEPPAEGKLLASAQLEGSGNQWLRAVARTPSGGMLLAGEFDGTVVFGSTALVTRNGIHAFVAMLDPMGGHLWSQRLGGTGTLRISAAAVNDVGTMVVSGTYTGQPDFGGGALAEATSWPQVFLLALDPMGGHLWAQGFGSDSGTVEPNGVALDPMGGAVVTGTYYADMQIGGETLVVAPNANPQSQADAFVAAFDPMGEHSWVNRYFSSSYDRGYDCAIAANGDIVIAGYHRSDMTGPGLAFTGTAGFIARLSPSGDAIWSHGSQGEGWKYTTAEAIAFDEQGNIYVAGAAFANSPVTFGMVQAVEFPSGGRGYYVLKLDAGGQALRGTGISVPGSDDLLWAPVRGLTVDRWGNTIIAARIKEPADFGTGTLTPVGSWDVVLAKLDSDGAALWAQSFGTDSDDDIGGVALDVYDNIDLVGSFSGSVDFGGGKLTSDQMGAFHAQFSP